MDENGTPTTAAVRSRIWKCPCELPHTVMRSCGVQPAGGGVRLYVALMDCLGSELALDGDFGLLEPRVNVADFKPRVAGDVVGEFGCSSGAPSAIASSTVVTGGRTSYSTSMRSRASSASWALSAATAAIGCPLNSALPRARILLLTWCRFWGGPPAAPTTGLFSYSGKSADVMTARTPGAASAREVSMLRMLAWACGLRRTLPWQHTGQRHVRAVCRLAGDLVVSVVSDRAGADHFVISSLGSHVGVYLRVLVYWVLLGGLGDCNTEGIFDAETRIRRDTRREIAYH